MNSEQPARNQRSVLWQAVGFAWDFGIIVVVPLVGLGVLGRFLDRQFGTQPWLFLGGVIISIVVSTVLVVIRLQSILRRLTDQTKTKKW